MSCRSGVMLLAALAAIAAAGPALAAPPQPPEPGVYKHRFQNALVSGERFTSEDILEVAAYRPDADYVRLHMEFGNGHLCDIWGVARITASALVYHGPNDSKGSPCVLTLQQSQDGVHIFEDQNGACRNQTCGARGGYGYDAAQPADFKTSERAPIRYMPRLLGSSEYKAAVAEYETHPPAL